MPNWAGSPACPRHCARVYARNGIRVYFWPPPLRTLQPRRGWGRKGADDARADRLKLPPCCPATPSCAPLPPGCFYQRVCPGVFSLPRFVCCACPVGMNNDTQYVRARHLATAEDISPSKLTISLLASGQRRRNPPYHFSATPTRVYQSIIIIHISR